MITKDILPLSNQEKRIERLKNGLTEQPHQRLELSLEGPS